MSEIISTHVNLLLGTDDARKKLQIFTKEINESKDAIINLRKENINYSKELSTVTNKYEKVGESINKLEQEEKTNTKSYQKKIEIQKQLHLQIESIRTARDKNTTSIKTHTENIDKNNLGVTELKKTLKNTELTFTELTQKKRQLEAAFKNTDPKTDEYKRLEKQLYAVTKEFNKQSFAIKDTRCSFSQMADTAHKYFYGMQGAYNLVSGVLNKLINLTQEYLTLSDKFSDVQKTTGLSTEAVRELDSELQKIDTRTSRQALLDLATDAGKLGISGKENVLQFVKAADQIKVALGEDLGEGAIRDIGKMADVFGLTKELGIEQSYLKIGSAINELGQSSSASESYLVDFTQRLSGVAAQSGISIENILGYASALDQGAQAVEVSATTMQNFIMKLFQEPAKFAKLAGKDVGDFTELLKTDANQAIKDVLTSLNSQGGFAALVPIFNQLGLDGSRSVGILSVMANKISDVEQAQMTANSAFAEGISMTNEFMVKNNNDAAAAEKRKKAILGLKVALGEQLVPVLAAMQNTLIGVMKVGFALFQFLGNNIKTIGLLTSAYIVYQAILNKEILINKGRAIWEAVVTQGRTLGTLATNLFALAHANLTGNTMAANYALMALNKTMAANPFGLIFSVLSAVVGLFLVFKDRTNEAAESSKQFQVELDKERDKVDDLFDVLKASEKGSKEYKSAKDALISQYGQYMKGLIDEKGELINIEEAYKRVNIAIENNIARKKMAEEQEKIIGDSIEEKSDVYEKMKANLNILFKEKNPKKDAREINRLVKAAFSEIVQDVNKGVAPELAAKNMFEKQGIDKKARTGFMRSTVFGNMVNLYLLEHVKKGAISKLEEKYAPYLSDDIPTTTVVVEDTTVVVPNDPSKEKPEDYSSLVEAQVKLLEEQLQKIRELQMSEDEKELARINESYDKKIAEVTKREFELEEAKKKGFTAEQQKDYDSFKKTVQPSLLAIEDNRESDIAEAQKKREEKRIKEVAEAEQKILNFKTKYGKKQENLEESKQAELAQLNKEAFESGLTDIVAYEEAKATIEEKYRKEQVKLEKEAADEKRKTLEDNIKEISQVLGDASALVGATKDLELQKAENSYEKEKVSYDSMLQSKTITKEEYDSKMLALEEKKDLEQKEIHKKYADIEFAIKVGQIITATALSIMQATALLGPIAGPISAVLIGAMGAAQVGLATAEREKVKGYSQGGYTGDGSVDEPAGIVHKGEYVIPKFLMRNPKAINYIQVLEAMRTNQRAYATGGVVSSVPHSTTHTNVINNNSNNSVTNELLIEIRNKLKSVAMIDLKRKLDTVNSEQDYIEKNLGIRP